MTQLLKLTDVSIRFSGLQALSGVGFSMGPGEIVAFVGPNGAGKTTLFNVISGFAVPNSGSIELRGVNIAGKTPSTIAAGGVRRTFQNGGIFGGMTVFENILTGLHAATTSGLMGLAFNTKAARRAEAMAEKRARELIEQMEFGAIADRFAKDLSGGQQRMLEIVRTMAMEPPVILLDEPAVGLSPTARIRMADMIQRLAKVNRTAVLLIEHSVELVMSISDRIVVLNAGKKIAEGEPDEIRHNKQVLEAYLG